VKLFLDSSFFFPFIRIKVKEFSKQDVSDLLKNEQFEVLRSDLVTFELSAKGTKYVNEGLLKIEDVIDGLNIIVYNSSIQVIPNHHSEIQILAAVLRKDHSDFIDCLTLASAIFYSVTFLTLDEEIEEKSRDVWYQLIKDSNETFNVTLWKDFIKQNPQP